MERSSKERSSKEPWQKRVVQEHAELTVKVTKLIQFLVDGSSENVGDYPLELLFRQMAAMRKYQEVLAERIDTFGGVTDGTKFNGT